MSYGLNLLPPSEKTTVAIEAARRQWVSMFTAAIVVLLFMLGGIWFLGQQLDQRLDILTTEETTLQQQASRAGSIDLTRDTTSVNTQIALLQTVLGTDRDWSGIARTVLSEIPANVNLTSMKISAVGTVTLTGTAASRASFLTLQAALESSKILKNPRTSDTPSKREALPFTYVATL